jgi:hypothetical protein
VRIIALVAGTAAAAAAVVIMTSRDADDSTAAESDPAGLAQPGSSLGPSDRGPRSTLPASRTPSPRAASDRPRPELALPRETQSFATEARDSSWAALKEGSVRDRVAELLGDSRLQTSNVECRTTQCRFAISGQRAAEFAAFVELIQGRDGFRGEATQLMLQDYAAGDESTPASVTVVLHYGSTGAGASATE